MVLNCSATKERLLLSDSRGPESLVPDSVAGRLTDLTLDQVADQVHWVIVFIITPTISILGIIGNSFSLVVLTKHGFKKSSNVLLFSLAISDILFMIGINGPPKPMYEWGAGGYPYPKITARVLYYLYQLTDSLNWTTGPTSLMIPVLVMIERLIAVFLPLHFRSLVTVRRTVIAIIIPAAIAVALQVYIRTWFQFDYIFDVVRNTSVGVATRTDIYWSTRHLAKCVEILYNALFILIIFVGCGCVAIGIKMKIVARNRLMMTNSFTRQTSDKVGVNYSRTTQMLLIMCIFYTLACAPTILSSVVPSFLVFPIFKEKPDFRSVGMFIYHLYKLAFCINSSNNFLIYVATNKKFRDTFISIIRYQHVGTSTRCSTSSLGRASTNL